MEVTKESLPGSPVHGHKTVGTTKVQLTDNTNVLYKGVLVRCPGADDPTPNTDPVWVGSSSVTADSNQGTGGLPIPPGSSLFIPVERASDLWVVSTAAAQDIAFIGS